MQDILDIVVDAPLAQGVRKVALLNILVRVGTVKLFSMTYLQAKAAVSHVLNC